MRMRRNVPALPINGLTNEASVRRLVSRAATTNQCNLGTIRRRDIDHFISNVEGDLRVHCA